MKKIKFLPITICLMLILSVSMSSFATNENENEIKIESSQKIKVHDDFRNVPNVTDSYGEYIGNMTFEEYFQYLFGDSFISLESVNGIVEEKMLYFTHYLQGTSPWGPYQLLKGIYTIGSHGCALTSATMAMRYLAYSDNPLEFNNKLLPFQPPGDGSMYWSYVSDAYPGVKIL